MKNNSSSSFSLNQAAALVLAVAVPELFPGTHFISGQGTDQYFFYDFVFPFAFRPEFLTLIEERMRMIVKEKRTMKALEMVPSNAAELLRHQGQPLAAEWLSSMERATVSLCQMGVSAFYSPDFCPLSTQIPFFKLFEGVAREELGRTVIRLIGAASEDKAVVKTLFKEASFASRSHTRIAQQLALMAPIEGTDRWIWRPRGKKMRDALMGCGQRLAQKENFSFVSLPTPLEGGERALMQAHLDYFLQFRERKVAEMVLAIKEGSLEPCEGFFSPGAYFTDRAYLFCSDQDFLEECISSLHFILQIPKLLGFEFEIVLTLSLEAQKQLRAQALSSWERALKSVGVSWRSEMVVHTPFASCVEVRFVDVLGRKWKGPFVGTPLDPMPVGEGKRLVCSLWGGFERVLALLLERTAGGSCDEQSLLLDEFCVKLTCLT